jgi:hypothetical protein
MDEHLIVLGFFEDKHYYYIIYNMFVAPHKLEFGYSRRDERISCVFEFLRYERKKRKDE